MYGTLAIIGIPVWRNAEHVCALSDDERHLGHVVRAGGWHAFDATKLNESGDAYRYIGAFRCMREANDAVESAVLTTGLRVAKTA